MYVTIADFIREWKWEAELTQKILEGLTDNSLQQKVSPEGRPLGRPEYLAQFGQKINELDNAKNIPAAAKEITDTFKLLSSTAIKVIEEQWTDESLKEVQ